MLIRNHRRWTSVKPPAGAQLDWGYPLAKAIAEAWVFAEGAGTLIRCVGGTRPNNNLVASGTSFQWVPTLAGIAVKLAGSSGNCSAFIPQYKTSTQPWSREMMCVQTTASTLAALSCVFEGTVGNSTRERSMTLTAANTIEVYVFDGSAKTAATVRTVSVGIPFVVTATCTASLLSIYLNGKFEASSVVSTCGFAYTNPLLCIGEGDRTASLSSSDAKVLRSIEYNRALTATEVRQRYDDNWAFMLEVPSRRAISPAAAGSFSPCWAAGANQVISGGYAT